MDPQEPAPPNEGTRRIPLTQGKYAIVDAADYPGLMRYRWRYLQPPGRPTGYAVSQTTVNGRQATLYMHRVIMAAPPEVQVDHRNGDGLFNTRTNLRLATRAQQTQNGVHRNTSAGSSRYRGVSWDGKNHCWLARIRAEGKCYHLGRYEDEHAAALAYDRAALALHGEFAIRNLPDEPVESGLPAPRGRARGSRLPFAELTETSVTQARLLQARGADTPTLAGRSTVQIARDLNTRGVPTLRGGTWYPATVRNIIYAPYYIGQAGFGKTQRVLPKTRRDPRITHRRQPKTAQLARPREQWLGEATVPAIIAPEMHQRAQAILQGNQRRHAQPAATAYALRGLLHCALHRGEGGEPCDYSLVGRAPKRKDGSVRRLYRCGWRTTQLRAGEPHTCPNQLPGAETEELVWNAVIDALQRSDDLHAALAQLEDAPRREREQWEGAIARLLEQRDRLRTQLRTQQRLLEEGTYTAADYAIARADILPTLEATERDLEHAQRSLAQVRAPRFDVPALEELCAQIAQKAQTAAPAVRAGVLADLLTRIDVHADRLEIQGILGDLVIPRHQLNTEGTRRISNEL